MANEHRRAGLRRDRPPRGLRRLRQRRQRILHAGAVDALRLEAGDDLRPAGAVGEQSVHEDDVPRLRRCLRAGDAIEQGEGRARRGSPDQCSAVHDSLRFSSGDFAAFRNRQTKDYYRRRYAGRTTASCDGRPASHTDTGPDRVADESCGDHCELRRRPRGGNFVFSAFELLHLERT